MQIRELANDFYASKYASSLAVLQRLLPTLLLDLYLGEHAEHLVQLIRKRAMVQFAMPFSTVKIESVASAFNTDVAGAERYRNLLLISSLIIFFFY